MKSYIDKADRYNKQFADGMVTLMRNKRYGISTCIPQKNLDLLIMRKELTDWQTSGDFTPISALKTNYKKWLPFKFCQDDLCYVSININNIEKECCAFEFTQNIPSTTWTIQHNLNYIPNVTTEDTNGEDIIGAITVVDDNQIIITFNNPVAGKAYLS